MRTDREITSRDSAKYLFIVIGIVACIGLLVILLSNPWIPVDGQYTMLEHVRFDFPNKVDELERRGWTISEYDTDKMVNPWDIEYFFMEKEGNELQVGVMNTTNIARPCSECTVDALFSRSPGVLNVFGAEVGNLCRSFDENDGHGFYATGTAEHWILKEVGAGILLFSEDYAYEE